MSSERYKTGITPMGSNSKKLQQLRPVPFHLKTDPKGALQYGLIAEEVAKVYPELVIRSGAGRIDGVRYDELGPMLLNEVQQQQRTLALQAQNIATQAKKSAAQAGEIAAQNEHIAAQAAEIRRLKQQQFAAQQELTSHAATDGRIAGSRPSDAGGTKFQAADELVAKR